MNVPQTFRTQPLLGKIAVVTGGASGLGRALCNALAKDGAFVLVSDVNGSKALEVANGIRQTGGSSQAHFMRKTEIKIPFTGGCACGAIRYQCSAEPVRMGQCHCRECQRFTGTAFVAAVIVPKESLQLLQGSPRFYQTQSSRGGHVHRGFCAECGSPVISRFDASPQFMGIHAASLDDPSWFHPAYNLWVSDAQPWDYLNPDLPKFEKYPQ